MNRCTHTLLAACRGIVARTAREDSQAEPFSQALMVELKVIKDGFSLFDGLGAPTPYCWFLYRIVYPTVFLSRHGKGTWCGELQLQTCASCLQHNDFVCLRQ